MHARLASLAMLALPTLALAAEDGAKPDPVGTPMSSLVPLIVAMVVFIIVLGFLAVAVWPKIVKGLDERANKIREEIASAEAARQQAKDALDQYQKSLAEARTEAQKMLDATKTQQTKLAQELKAKAEIEASDLKDKALRDIEAARKAAVSEMYNDAANLATMIASKLLAREVSSGDQQRLIDEAIGEMNASNN